MYFFMARKASNPGHWIPERIRITNSRSKSNVSILVRESDIILVWTCARAKRG